MIKRALELGGLERVLTACDGVLASLAYDLYGLYNSNGQNTFVLVYNFGSNFIEVGIIEIDEGVFEVVSTSEDTSINDKLLHSELVEHMKEIYPDLRDVEPSLVSSSSQLHFWLSLGSFLLSIAKLDEEMKRVRNDLSSQDTARFSITLPRTGQSLRGTITQNDFVRSTSFSMST
jgi:molecular chaperone DnaK (HSP70)